MATAPSFRESAASTRVSRRREREREILAATRLLFDERGLQDAPDREHRARCRHQQGIDLPLLLLQGGAVRADPVQLPCRSGRAVGGGARQARSGGPPGGGLAALHELLPGVSGVPGLRALADAPLGRGSAREHLRRHLDPPRPEHGGLPGQALADPRRRCQAGRVRASRTPTSPPTSSTRRHSARCTWPASAWACAPSAQASPSRSRSSRRACSAHASTRYSRRRSATAIATTSDDPPTRG